MKKLLNIIALLSCTIMMQAQTNALSLDELLRRVNIGMTQEEYFEEFKNELHILDSSNSDFVVSDDLVAAFWGGADEVQQKANELKEDGVNSSESVNDDQNEEEKWVIDLDVEEFGKCIALAVFNEDGCALAILPNNETQTMQSSYLLKKAKMTMGKYATSDIIEFMTTETMDVYAGIWKSGMLMILQAMTEQQCVTMLVFQYTTKQAKEEDLKLAAEYFRTGEIPEETTASYDSFEYPSIRVVKWGDTRATVMRKEGKYDGLTRYSENKGEMDRYLFFDRINGYDCSVMYGFDDCDRAYVLLYMLNNVAKEYSIVAYDNMKTALTRKYGTPRDEQVNKRYNYTKEEWQQVYYGNLSYESSWVTEDFVCITLVLTTVSDEISCSIRYQYLPLLMIQQESAQSNL